MVIKYKGVRILSPLERYGEKMTMEVLKIALGIVLLIAGIGCMSAISLSWHIDIDGAFKNKPIHYFIFGVISLIPLVIYLLILLKYTK